MAEDVGQGSNDGQGDAAIATHERWRNHASGGIVVEGLESVVERPQEEVTGPRGTEVVGLEQQL